MTGSGLTDEQREAVLAKARADRKAQGLPESVEDPEAIKGLSELLVRVHERMEREGRTIKDEPKPKRKGKQ